MMDARGGVSGSLVDVDGEDEGEGAREESAQHIM